jgi:hypothetical protein
MYTHMNKCINNKKRVKFLKRTEIRGRQLRRDKKGGKNCQKRMRI